MLILYTVESDLDREKNDHPPNLEVFHMSQLGLPHTLLMRDRFLTRCATATLVCLVIYIEKTIRDGFFYSDSTKSSYMLFLICIVELVWAVRFVYPFIYSVYLWRGRGEWPARFITMTVLYAEWEGQYEDMPDELEEGIHQTNEELFSQNLGQFILAMYRYIISGAAIKDAYRYLRHRIAQGQNRRYALPRPCSPIQDHEAPHQNLCVMEKSKSEELESCVD